MSDLKIFGLLVDSQLAEVREPVNHRNCSSGLLVVELILDAEVTSGLRRYLDTKKCLLSNWYIYDIVLRHAEVLEMCRASQQCGQVRVRLSSRLL